jgi:hydrogenase-4 membrane subunit HyfE
MDALFSQLVILASSFVLILGLTLLWRRRSAAHITAFTAQSVTLAATAALVAFFTGHHALYVLAGLFLAVKGVAIPLLLGRMARRFGTTAELEPYVNTATSLLLGGALVLLAYVVARPLVELSRLPTRGGMPLALGLVFVSLLVLVTRKKALTQILAFLMLENGIALLALLGTYGIPLIVEMGVFLDALMGFLVMQVFVYRIHETFESIDVEQLNRLRR